MYRDLDLLRYKIAKERGVPFDQRTYYQAFFEEKDEEPMLSPRYQFTSAYWSPILYGPNNPFQKYIKSKKQISKSKISSQNEKSIIKIKKTKSNPISNIKN